MSLKEAMLVMVGLLNIIYVAGNSRYCLGPAQILSLVIQNSVAFPFIWIEQGHSSLYTMSIVCNFDFPQS